MPALKCGVVSGLGSNAGRQFLADMDRQGYLPQR